MAEEQNIKEASRSADEAKKRAEIAAYDYLRELIENQNTARFRAAIAILSKGQHTP